MEDLTDEQIKTLTPAVLVLLFLNVAGWWLFPAMMLLVIPITLVAFALIGQYLHGS